MLAVPWKLASRGIVAFPTCGSPGLVPSFTLFSPKVFSGGTTVCPAAALTTVFSQTGCGRVSCLPAFLVFSFQLAFAQVVIPGGPATGSDLTRTVNVADWSALSCLIFQATLVLLEPRVPPPLGDAKVAPVSVKFTSLTVLPPLLAMKTVSCPTASPGAIGSKSVSVTQTLWLAVPQTGPAAKLAAALTSSTATAVARTAARNLRDIRPPPWGPTRVRRPPYTRRPAVPGVHILS